MNTGIGKIKRANDCRRLPIFMQRRNKPVRGILGETRQASRHWSADQTAFQHAHQIACQNHLSTHLHQSAQQRGSGHAGLILCPTITAPKPHQAMAAMTDQGWQPLAPRRRLKFCAWRARPKPVISVAQKRLFSKNVLPLAGLIRPSAESRHQPIVLWQKAAYGLP